MSLDGEVGATASRPQCALLQMALFICSASKRPCFQVYVWCLPRAIINRPYS